MPIIYTVGTPCRDVGVYVYAMSSNLAAREHFDGADGKAGREMRDFWA